MSPGTGSRRTERSEGLQSLVSDSAVRARGHSDPRRPQDPSPFVAKGPGGDRCKGSGGAVASFPCPNDITSSRNIRPYLATRLVNTGEASVVYMHPCREPDRTPKELSEEEELLRQIQNVKRSEQRAKKQLRLFIVANVLTRMWTLTYAGEHWDRDVVIADVNDWLQRLRVHLDRRFPAAYVLELHPEGHGIHVHVAMESRFIYHPDMQRLWGHGLVQYSDGNKAIKRIPGKRAKARALAGYLSKYMAKGWVDLHRPGQHRYERTQGFGVERVRRVFRTLGDALAWLDAEEGAAPVSGWHSDSSEDWTGPPCWVLTYD